MKLLLTSIVASFLLIAYQGAALTRSSPHCEQWLNGKCAKGPLSTLAQSIKKDAFSVANRSAICDRVCNEACPKCYLCDFCDFCGIYNDAACLDVPYYVDETCTVQRTDSCCKLCEVQCRKSDGVCGTKGFCQTKGEQPGVDLMSRCVAQTTGEECMPCSKNPTKL